MSENDERHNTVKGAELPDRSQYDIKTYMPESRATNRYEPEVYEPDPFDLHPAPADLGLSIHPRKHIREYYRLLMKRKWIILTCVAVALIVAAVYTLRRTPLYQATAKLEIDQESDNVLPYQNVMQPQTSGYYDYQEFLQTQIKHLTSRTFASHVAVALGLDREIQAAARPRSHWGFLLAAFPGRTEVKETIRVPNEEERLEEGIDLVLDHFKVTPVRNSRVVEISYTSPDPKLAARIVNSVLKEYIEYNFQAKYDANTQATDFLQKQLVDLKAKVEQSDSALIDYAQSHSIMSVGDKQDVVTQALADISSALTKARSERMEKEAAYGILAKATPDNFPQALRTPLIAELEGALLVEEPELAKLSAQLGAGMPQVKQLEAKINRMKEQLLKEKRLALENSDNEYRVALAHENLLSGSFAQQKALAERLNESNIHYSILKREVETNKQLYDGLLQRMKEAGVAAGLKSSNIRIVDPARVPGIPINNDLTMNLALALALGLAVGFSIALFLNYLDNNIKTPEDVEEKLGLPALGLIPNLQSANHYYGYYHRHSRRKLQSLALAKSGVELASLTAGSSPIAEAYRGLRTALLLSMPSNPPRSIMVTSPRADEGKTTTVCNTAISLAQAGKTVLIMDCDMRRPRIRKIFSGNGNAGLSEYLSGQIDFDALVQGTAIPNLFVAYSGAAPPNPGELLGSTRMKDGLSEAVRSFDFVLLDTPPIMSVTDPLILAPMADGVIIVTKGGKNPPDIMNRVKKNLKMVRARIIGVLCNNVDLVHSDYHHYLKQYYEYASYLGEAPSATHSDHD